MKRKWNQSADRLASESPRQERGKVVILDQDRQDLITLNRLGELLLPEQVDHAVKKGTAITRSALRRRCQPRILKEEVVQQIRVDRI